ncbi:MAG TPA: carboxypeptidase-like regulatory domain-containing protein [Pyrinomonadaceae bacterium]|nr:carboxypeptidase-like regulatory domain-containing protein [Pyrinomonadaceae bacterium]
MIRTYLLGLVLIALVGTVAAVPSFAQVGELRGHVFMQQADGQKVPLADAQIDVFRTDVNAKYNTKTNKKGEFVFAGLPFVGTYTVAASHPTASPNFVNGFKVGRDIDCELLLTPGDGKRLTFDEIKSVKVSAPTAGSGGGGGGSSESAADKAKREELLKKNKEIEESNKKINEANATVARTFKAGNEALNAASAASKANNTTEAVQKYTDAITQFDEGLAADSEQPALLTNKAAALKGRGVERYNSTVRSKDLDEAAKAQSLDAAKTDFKGAAEASTKAVTLIKAQPQPTDPTELTRYNANKYASLITNIESLRLYVSKADPSKADEALAAFKEYISIETDPAKKLKAQLDAAQMLMDAGAADKAFAEFQSIVTAQPDNADANLGAGLSLFAQGDKSKFQDAANYLQHFVDVAPESHAYKADAKAILTELKNTEKVVPEKSTPATRRKRP